jgi:hypothetical protein
VETNHHINSACPFLLISTEGSENRDPTDGFAFWMLERRRATMTNPGKSLNWRYDGLGFR